MYCRPTVVCNTILPISATISAVTSATLNTTKKHVTRKIVTQYWRHSKHTKCTIICHVVTLTRAGLTFSYKDFELAKVIGPMNVVKDDRKSGLCSQSPIPEYLDRQPALIDGIAFHETANREAHILLCAYQFQGWNSHRYFFYG